MYGVLGEDDSDAKTVKVLIRRLLRDEKAEVKPKGFDGCGSLLRKGARQLKLFADLGCTRFVVCYDADENDPAEKLREITEKVVGPSGVGAACCVVVPVQEIEAWILADIEAVTKVFPSWSPARFRRPPESVRNPKEVLERLSRFTRRKPIYSHATHNPIVAAHLDLKRVNERCPSFRRLVAFVRPI